MASFWEVQCWILFYYQCSSCILAPHIVVGVVDLLLGLLLDLVVLGPFPWPFPLPFSKGLPFFEEDLDALWPFSKGLALGVEDLPLEDAPFSKGSCSSSWPLSLALAFCVALSRAATCLAKPLGVSVSAPCSSR